MCGVIGIAGPNRLSDAAVTRLLTLLEHRGPDDQGLFRWDHGALLHRRLSILDPSPRGRQPMRSDDGLLTIAHNGEVYNFKEVREDLSRHGLAHTTGTDTEVILNAYAAWAAGCVRRFRGMWAFAILDQRRKKIFISRDPFGIKPLYYVFKDGMFAFASEIKALLGLDFVDPDADAGRLAGYLAYGAAGDPHENIFRDIMDLPPGHNLHFDLESRSLKIERYYDLSERVREKMHENPEEAVDRYRKLFERSLSLHLRSDVPVGSCLSGGLDSSAIVSLAAGKMAESDFQTFTASYPGEDFDETPYARKVAASGSNIRPFFTRPTSADLIADMDRFIYHQDLPVGSLSVFSQWMVMKLAGEHGAKVLLDGQGADEVLGGYRHFAGAFLVEHLRRRRVGAFFRHRRLLGRNFTPRVDEAFAGALFYFLPGALKKFLRARMRLGMRALSPEFRALARETAVPERAGRSFLQSSLNGIRYGLYELLRYEDRNSMAFSIEARLPFLEQDLVEFSLSLPPGIKVQEGWSKAVLRKAMEGRLPREILRRREKLGFVAPQRRWKAELLPHLAAYIRESALAPVFDVDFLARVCRRDAGRDIDLSEFWRIYSVLKWLEVFGAKVR